MKKEILNIANDFFKKHKIKKLIIKKISFYYINDIIVLVIGKNETLEINFNYSSSFQGNTKEWFNPKLNLKLMDFTYHCGHRKIIKTYFVLEDFHNNFSIISSNCYLKKLNLCKFEHFKINQSINIAELTLLHYQKLLENYHNKRVCIINSAISAKENTLKIWIEKDSTDLYQKQQDIHNNLENSFPFTSLFDDNKKLKIECNEPLYLNFQFFDYSLKKGIVTNLKLTTDNNLFIINNKDETFKVICKNITMSVVDICE